MGSYAQHTKVPVSRSRDELERTLVRYGCSAFGYLQRQGAYVIQFEHEGRTYRFGVEADEEEREIRRRWRVLLLWVKATLEAVDVGLQDFETAFAMQTMLPDGSTLQDKIRPELERLAQNGKLPRLTAGGTR